MRAPRQRRPGSLSNHRRRTQDRHQLLDLPNVILGQRYQVVATAVIDRRMRGQSAVVDGSVANEQDFS